MTYGYFTADISTDAAYAAPPTFASLRFERSPERTSHLLRRTLFPFQHLQRFENIQPINQLNYEKNLYAVSSRCLAPRFNSMSISSLQHFCQ